MGCCGSKPNLKKNDFTILPEKPICTVTLKPVNYK